MRLLHMLWVYPTMIVISIITLIAIIVHHIFWYLNRITAHAEISYSNYLTSQVMKGSLDKKWRPFLWIIPHIMAEIILLICSIFVHPFSALKKLCFKALDTLNSDF